MKSRYLKSAGFTLIELMVVMLIILVLSGASLTAYLNFNKVQTLVNDARNFTSEVHRVRTLAATQQYPSGCTSLKGYGIKSEYVDGILTGTVVTTYCDPEDQTAVVNEILSGTIFTAPFDLMFLPGSGYLENGVDQKIIIENSKDSTLNKEITIGAYGKVNI